MADAGSCSALSVPAESGLARRPFRVAASQSEPRCLTPGLFCITGQLAILGAQCVFSSSACNRSRDKKHGRSEALRVFRRHTTSNVRELGT